MKNTKIIQVQKYEKISSRRVKLSLLINFNGRTIAYEVIVNQISEISFEIEDGKFNLDYTPTYNEEALDSQTLENLDKLIRLNLGSRLTISHKLLKVENDGPSFKFYYITNTVVSVVQFIYDPLLNQLSLVTMEDVNKSAP